MSKSNNSGTEPIEAKQKKICGIIMPIAPHPDYPADHWKDVFAIISQAIRQTEFEAKLVSDDVAIGLIHDRIVTNIYNNEIVVCDVSSKNPNVMFELGLRLAFDKPTIIIKDETTGYSFDTGVIEHLSYPSSLRHQQIEIFKEELARKINATYAKSKDDPKYSPFLKSFGKKIIPAELQQTEIPEGKYILEQIHLVRQEMKLMRLESGYPSPTSSKMSPALSEVDKLTYIQFVLFNFRNKHSSGTSSPEAIYPTVKAELSARGIDITFSEFLKYFSSFNRNIENGLNPSEKTSLS